MRTYLGYQFVHALRELVACAISCEECHAEDGTRIANVKKAIGEARDCCLAIGLVTSHQEAIEILADYAAKIRPLGERARHLSQTIEREARQHQFLVISPEYAKLFSDKGVVDGLPSELSELRYDLEEAKLCLALERTTASVMHLCLVMEFATEKLREKIKAPKPSNGTMGQMVTEIENTVQRWKKDVTKDTDTIKKFESAIWPLKSFVKGVRNQEMHRSCLNEVYKQEEARALFHNVTTHLAEITPLLKLPL